MHEWLHAVKVACIVLVICRQTQEDGATDANEEVDERWVLDVHELLAGRSDQMFGRQRRR